MWYELGRLYSRAGGGGRRATRVGFAVVCVCGALVLLSAPLLGTAWAGVFAPAIPVAAGLVAGGGPFLWERLRLRGRARVLRGMLRKRGLDPARPAREGLGAYYDAQLVLLRSEYEYLRLRGGRGALKTARAFEEAFGFSPEDPFETGPLNVAPDTAAMGLLRELWEGRIAGMRERGAEPPAFGLGEDATFRVLPREMTVPVELATRAAYLEISREVVLRRYGRDPRGWQETVPRAVLKRIERDLREHAALNAGPARRA